MVWYALAALNVLTFALYGWDKRCARRGWRRVPEKTLLGLSALGGSLGALVGMRLFRHKTRHWYFAWGVPAMLLCHGFLLLWYLYAY